jgi:cystathionine beta-lyase
MGLTEPGDKIVVQPPVYFPFFYSVTNHKRELLYNQLREVHGQYQMDFAHLEEQFKRGVKMFFFCHPHNPVGRVWNREELEQLADLCVRYHVLVISDEIHSDLTLFGNKHIPLASLGREISDLTITCVAPSKTFNLAGLYTSAVIILNPELYKKYDRILDVVHVGGGNIFGQVAMEAAYTHGDDWLDQLIVYLEHNYQFLKEEIETTIPEIIVSPLQATYLAWLNFSSLGKDDSDLKEFIINQARLGLNDGPMFGPGGEQHQRLNIAAPLKVLKEGVNRLLNAVKVDR